MSDAAKATSRSRAGSRGWGSRGAGSRGSGSDRARGLLAVWPAGFAAIALLIGSGSAAAAVPASPAAAVRAEAPATETPPPDGSPASPEDQPYAEPGVGTEEPGGPAPAEEGQEPADPEPADPAPADPETPATSDSDEEPAAENGAAAEQEAGAPTASAPTAAGITPPFVDVKPGDKFYAHIEWMRKQGLAHGVETPRGPAYLPASSLTRGAMAAFMYRQAKPKGFVPPRTSPFVDVPVGHKFYVPIAWMHSAGLAAGVDTAAGRAYLPDASLTRGAMAAFLYRSAGPKGFTPPKSSGFVDVPANHTFYRPITWMNSKRYGVGVCTPRGKEFLAAESVTRGAMAAFLYRVTLRQPSEAPKCAKPDLSTPWSTTVVVNKRRPMQPITWQPSDLRWPAGIVNANGQPLRAEAAGALERMYAAAASAGRPFKITSAYRSYWLQNDLFNAYVRRDGVAAAESYSARPGYSEHQTGLVADLGDWSGCDLETCFESTPAGLWLRDNAYRFGFIRRYEWGQQSVVGYIYEPWHFRYVGVAVATDMKKRGFVNLETYFGLPNAPSY